jgi:NADH:ubiquinone oxidoreductase subunit 2 (subunit N)
MLFIAEQFFPLIYPEACLALFILLQLTYFSYFSTNGILYAFTPLLSSGVYQGILSLFLIILLFLSSSGILYVSPNDTLSFYAYTSFFQNFLLFTSAVALGISVGFLVYRRVFLYEYAIICLLSIVGLLFACSSSDLLSLFLVIELQSLAFYLLATFQRNSEFSVEAGVKYFVLGSFSSCLLLFGFSLIYLSLGSCSFEALQSLCGYKIDLSNTIFWGMLFCFAAFLFKIGASPFHL